MKKLSLLFGVIFLQACAFTDATLSVQHDASADLVGPISETPAIAFSQPHLDDSRLDQERIGWKKNGFGQNTADIVTEQPVTRIVEDALSDAITDNGHRIGNPGEVRVQGTIERFWFETDTNFWTVEFIGNVQTNLEFVDTDSNEVIYSSTYSGSYKDKKGGGLEKTWTEVMSKAVDNLIEDIVLDDELTDALSDYE